MAYTFDEALDEIIIGRVAFDDDRHNMALYAIQNFRVLKQYLPESKHGAMSELVIAFLRDEIDSFAFEQKAKELQVAM